MTGDTRLNELLSRWERLREQGQDASSEQICAEYPELADDFRRHVRALEAVNARLGSAEQDTDPAPRSPKSGDTSLPQLLHTQSCYRVLGLHARGGLGEVLLAQDEELHREVALKRIQEPFDRQPERRERFLREAEITSRLEHPGIVPVYGLGQDGDGRPCYVMRLIRGETLQEAIRRFHEPDGQRAGEGGLDLRKLLGRFVSVCNAVAYAHSQGVVHRDLKPANIMLGPYGETLLVDWGLAKRLKDEPAARMSQLKTLKYFDSLRGRPDFRKLLAELEDASKPVK